MKETLPPRVSLCGVSTTVEIVSNRNGSRTDISDSVGRPGDCVEDSYNDVSRRRDVTINGVSLMETKKIKNNKNTMKKQDKKTVTKGRKN